MTVQVKKEFTMRHAGNDVLLVEDSKAVATLLRASINALQGISCSHASTLAEAKTLLEDDSDRFFVAVLDLNLPDAPNGEVVDLVQEYGIPVVVLTGSVDAKHREAMLKKNIADYVSKANLSGLGTVVRLLERMRANREQKILVVDDSATFRSYLEALLHNHGYQTLAAKNGEEGVAMLQANAEINLVLTDYNMPEMDGLAMIDVMRRTRSADDLAIIGLSTVSEKGILPRFLKSGANDFLTKPFETEELYCRIDQNIDMLHYIAEARDAANRDFLTKLYNRRYFFEYASPVHAKAQKGELRILLSMIDADHFKNINDTHGHQTGDDALISMAETLRNAVGDGGVLARFGGEEFVCLQILDDADEPEVCLETLRAAVEAIQLKTSEGEAVPITVSIGSTLDPLDDLDKMLGAADEGVYQAKERGRNCFVVV